MNSHLSCIAIASIIGSFAIGCQQPSCPVMDNENVPLYVCDNGDYFCGSPDECSNASSNRDCWSCISQASTTPPVATTTTPPPDNVTMDSCIHESCTVGGSTICLPAGEHCCGDYYCAGETPWCGEYEGDCCSTTGCIYGDKHTGIY